jgi:hypothetical protein
MKKKDEPATLPPASPRPPKNTHTPEGTKTAVDSQADMLRLKTKYQTGKGSIDGFDAWSDEMIKKGKTIAQMEAALDKALAPK